MLQKIRPDELLVLHKSSITYLPFYTFKFILFILIDGEEARVPLQTLLLADSCLLTLSIFDKCLFVGSSIHVLCSQTSSYFGP